MSLPITLAITTWKKPNTLRNTLQSYKDNGLLELCAGKMIWANGRTEEHNEIAAQFGFNIFGGPRNIGAGYPFLRLTELCNTEYILFLEDDFVLVEPIAVAKKELDVGLSLLSNNEVDTYRLRHRKQPGNPLCSEDMRGREYICPPLFLESVFFRDNPHLAINEIWQHETGAFITSCQYSMYTNNPVLYKTDWVYNNIVLRAEPSHGELYSGFERYMGRFWLTINPVVSHAAIGLFSHIDLGN
jgi:hypothetical protein